MSEEEYQREVEALGREHDELQCLIEERCRLAEERWRATHPWLVPGWCVTVPVRRLDLRD